MRMSFSIISVTVLAASSQALLRTIRIGLNAVYCISLQIYPYHLIAIEGEAEVPTLLRQAPIALTPWTTTAQLRVLCAFIEVSILSVQYANLAMPISKRGLASENAPVLHPRKLLSITVTFSLLSSILKLRGGSYETSQAICGCMPRLEHEVQLSPRQQSTHMASEICLHTPRNDAFSFLLSIQRR